MAWRALGVAPAAYEAALAYAKEREQFGRPPASFQLVPDKLSRMVGEITAMQLLCLRLSELAGDERLTPGIADSIQSLIVGRELTGIQAIAPSRE